MAAQRILGHANVATTTRYDKRGERAARNVASLVYVPYSLRA